MAMRAIVAKRVSTDTQTKVLEGRVSIDWDDFRVFIAVAEHGSFRKAAIALGLQQPTVTRRVAKLEQMIGARLFARNRRLRELTHAGREVLKNAKAAELALLEASVPNRGSGAAEGDCKLLVTDGLAAYWITRFLPGFQATHPGIELKLFTTADPSIAQRPLFDLQVQYSAAIEADAVPLRLGTLHFLLFASPDYLTTFGTPKHLSDLANHHVLDLTLSLASKGRFSSYSTVDNAPWTRFFSNSSCVLAEAVRAGAGISMLPTYAVLVDNRFVPLLLDSHWSTGVFVNFDREIAQKPAVRAVLDYFKETVFDRKKMPWFRDEFVAPDPSWHDLFRARLGRSRLRAIDPS